MSLESALDEFPKDLLLKSGLAAQVKPLDPGDAGAFHQFFVGMPKNELMFIKHRVTELPVIQEWCDAIDHGRNLPLLAWADSRIIGVSTLHQQLGGWKRHIGRVSVHVHPSSRGRGLAQALVHEAVEVARSCGLEKVEAEFIGGQEGAMKMFGLLGFSQLVNLPDYVKDMQAVTHDYVLMGQDLVTDEEYAGMG